MEPMEPTAPPSACIRLLNKLDHGESPQLPNNATPGKSEVFFLVPKYQALGRFTYCIAKVPRR